MQQAEYVDLAIDAIYDAATNTSSWPDALHRVAKCTDDVGAVLIWKRSDGVFGTIASPSLIDAQNEYAHRWWQHDIRAQRAVEGSYWATNEVVTDDDAITPEEMDTHPIYTEFLAKFGLRFTASVGVSPDPKIQAGMSVLRAQDKPQFRAEEKAIISRLARHVEKSFRLGASLIELDATTDTLGEALRRTGVAVFTLDHRGKVLFRNDAAERLADVIKLRRGHLTILDDGRELSLDAIFGRPVGQDVISLPPVLVRKSGGGSVVLQLFPFRKSGSLPEMFLRQSQVILLAIDQDEQSTPDPSTLRDFFGLTLAEARLAVLIAQGTSPRAAAQQLNISEETARSVLKRIFAKTGTNRQSQVAALIGGIGLRR
jgi:DNA-binding CsgD family transcriptional regulator/PAS domain-containing protein